MSVNRFLKLGLMALLLALVSASQSAAQDNNSSVTGTVMDDQGQVLPGATVTIINEATKASRSGVTDARGDFKFLTMQPGTYTIKVELSGFRGFEKRSNVLNVSQALSLGDVKLAIGQLTETVIVESSGAKVDVEETQHAGLLTSTQIEQLQSKGRDVVNLLRAIPGVRYGGDTDALGDSFGTDVPNISGQRNNWARTTVDGMNGSESGGGGKVGSALSLDAISEVKVLLNLQGRVRRHGRRADPDRQQGRRLAVPRHGLLAGPAHQLERQPVGEQQDDQHEHEPGRRQGPVRDAAPRRRLQHVRLQLRRPRPRAGHGQEAVLLL